VAPGEGPFEGRCGSFIVALEGEQTLLQFGQRREIVGCEDFSLNDREIDFDLIEPTGVDWSVDEDCVGPLVAKALDSFLAAMSGAVVHDPKDAASGLVGLLSHDFADEPIHRSNPALDFAATENLRPRDIPSRQVAPGPSATVLVASAHGPD